MNVTQRDLKKVINEIEKLEYPKVKDDPWRLGFHLMPPIGWLNDPNGLCYFKERYHVFFQYSPFNVEGGIKVWGHYKSRDLIHWEYEGTPIVTDQAEDAHGVYSGSAYVEGDKAYLYYTGNVKRLGNYDYTYSGREANTILIETEDMKTFGEKECVMTNKDYGDDMSCHVRDPKVWKDGESYYMVQGARTKTDQGKVLVFESKDKRNWKMVNQITSKEPFGYMWECPDFFSIEGINVLSVSPQGLEADGLAFCNIYQSGYFVIEGDLKGDYKLGTFCEWDRGFDFYAPQTFEDEKGRRILIGWMGLPDCEEEYTNPTQERGWQHCLTLPRELQVKEGKVYQMPLAELKALRKAHKEYEVEQNTITIEGNLLEEIILADIKDGQDFKLTLNEEVVLSFSKSSKIFTLSFLNASGAGRSSRGVHLEALHSMRIFRDHSAIEVFINEGEEVFSTRYYPNHQESKMEVSCQQASITVWELGEMSYGI